MEFTYSGIRTEADVWCREFCIGYGYGLKHEYVYNERDLGIEKVTFFYENDQWVPNAKGEYEYDDADNIVDEVLYYPLEGDWQPYAHNTATWDNINRQASIESHEWNGLDWVGVAKEDLNIIMIIPTNSLILADGIGSKKRIREASQNRREAFLLVFCWRIPIFLLTCIEMLVIAFILVLSCLIPAPAMRAEARQPDYAKMAESPARDLFTKANEYQQMNDVDTAMAYYLYTIGAFDINSSEENQLICAKAYNEFGKAYFNFGHYSKAFDSFANAIKICEANGFSSLLPHIYNNLGSIYCTWNDWEQGIHYFQKAFEITDSASQPELYRKLLINMIGAECENANVKAGVNSKYVSKVINEAYGCNFRAFINEIRIREAQRRLLDTDRYGSFTIKAIAESVGYKSHANFILLFKKYVGISPSQYQKMATEDKE